jgi:hypothetical protein
LIPPGVVPFKYRAANYGKLFPADGGPRLLEFRISDLLSPEEIPAVERVLASVVARGTAFRARDPDYTFRSPFGEESKDVKIGRDSLATQLALRPLNGAITDLEEERYEAFLRGVDLRPEDFPRPRNPFENPARYSKAELDKLLQEVPLDRPVTVKGGNLSFGFEVEFRPGARGQNVVTLDGEGAPLRVSARSTSSTRVSPRRTRATSRSAASRRRRSETPSGRWRN